MGYFLLHLRDFASSRISCEIRGKSQTRIAANSVCAGIPTTYYCGEKNLADIHINYETQAEYPLEMIENKDEKLDWTVEKMRYNKDKTSVFYNDFLTLGSIPPEAQRISSGKPFRARFDC